jgi:hypothetical protein
VQEEAAASAAFFFFLHWTAPPHRAETVNRAKATRQILPLRRFDRCPPSPPSPENGGFPPIFSISKTGMILEWEMADHHVRGFS